MYYFEIAMSVCKTWELQGDEEW